MDIWNCLYTFIIGGLFLVSLDLYSKHNTLNDKCTGLLYANPAFFAVALIVLYRNKIKKAKIANLSLYSSYFTISVAIWQILLNKLLKCYSFKKGLLISLLIWSGAIACMYFLIK